MKLHNGICLNVYAFPIFFVNTRLPVMFITMVILFGIYNHKKTYIMHYLVDMHRRAELILNYSYHYIFLNIIINYQDIIKLNFKFEGKY